MTTFSHAELELLWINAGGDRFAADTAAAVAQAESGGCQYAKHGPTDDRPVKQCRYNFSTKENSYGLWQINRNAHPQYTPRELYDAAGNAAAAVAVAGTPPVFRPWTEYRNDDYKQYLTGTLPPTAGAGSTYPRMTPPPVRVTNAWRHVVTLLYRDIPANVARSARARARMTRKAG